MAALRMLKTLVADGLAVSLFSLVSHDKHVSQYRSSAPVQLNQSAPAYWTKLHVIEYNIYPLKSILMTVMWKTKGKCPEQTERHTV